MFEWYRKHICVRWVDAACFWAYSYALLTAAEMTVKISNQVHTLLQLLQRLVTLRITRIQEPLYTLIPVKQTPSKAESILAAGEWAETVCQLLLAAVFKNDPVLSHNSQYDRTGEKNNPESFKSSSQYSLSPSFKVLYNLINRIKVIGQNRAKQSSFHISVLACTLHTESY